MAIYHLAAQVISRGYGHSAVHAAAYRARADLVDERTGLKHDYSRKSGELLFEGIYAPKDAPDWARDRAQLWNHVEAFEKHRKAELAREFVIALPHELTLEQNRYALQDWVRENFTRKGLIADVTIHRPDGHGDQRNMHAHIMVVMRKLDGSEFARTKERFDTFTEKQAAKTAELEHLRESWAHIGNRHLERRGFEPTLDHRTLAAQGIEREPTIHVGKSATAIERDGKPSELGSANREIVADNERRVIDLAAERAMRQARDAARGQVDDIRPLAMGAEKSQTHDAAAEIQRAQQEAFANARGRRDEVRSAEWQAAAQEAVQRPKWTVAGKPRAEHQSASQAPEIAPTAAPAPAPEIMRGAERAVGGIFGGLARLAENVLGGLLSLFAGAEPKQTAQQIHDQQQAAGNVETQHAQAHEAAQREKDERLNELLDQMRRDDNDRRATPEYFRPITRPVNRGRDRDEGYEREREIER